MLWKLLTWIDLKSKLWLIGVILATVLSFLIVGTVTVTSVIYVSLVVILSVSLYYEWVMVKQLAKEPEKLKSKWTLLMLIPGLVSLGIIIYFFRLIYNA